MTQASKKRLSANLIDLMDTISKAAKSASASPQKSIPTIAQTTFKQINNKHSDLEFTAKEIEDLIQLVSVQNWSSIQWNSKINEWDSLILCCSTIPVTQQRLEYLFMMKY